MEGYSAPVPGLPGRPFLMDLDNRAPACWSWPHRGLPRATPLTPCLPVDSLMWFGQSPWGPTRGRTGRPHADAAPGVAQAGVRPGQPAATGHPPGAGLRPRSLDPGAKHDQRTGSSGAVSPELSRRPLACRPDPGLGPCRLRSHGGGYRTLQYYRLPSVASNPWPLLMQSTHQPWAPSGLMIYSRVYILSSTLSICNR